MIDEGHLINFSYAKLGHDMIPIYGKYILYNVELIFSKMLESKLRSTVYLLMVFFGTSISDSDLKGIGNLLVIGKPNAWFGLSLFVALNAALTIDVATASKNIHLFEGSLPLPRSVPLWNSPKYVDNGLVRGSKLLPILLWADIA